MAATVADIAVNIAVKGAQQAQSDLSNVHAKAKEGGNAFLEGAKGALGFATSLGGVALAAAGFSTVTDYFQGAIQGAMDMQVAQENTNRILSSGSHVAGLTGAAIDALSQSLMNQTGVDDDVVRGAENILAGYSGISKKAYPDVAAAALDMARAQSEATGATFDANASAKALGIALSDPAKAARLLRGENILLSDSQQKAIATALKHHDIAKADAVIMDAVKAKVGGASAAYRETASGGMMAFNTAMGNIQKTIGAAVLPELTNLLSGVLPIATAFATNLPGAISAAEGALNSLQPPINFIVTNGDMIKTVLIGVGAGVIAVTAPIIIGLVPAFIAWAVAAGAAAVATIIAAAPIVAIIAGVALLVVGIKLLIDHWGAVSAFFGNLGGIIGSTVGNILGAIGNFIGGAIAWFQQLPGRVWGIVESFAAGAIIRFGQFEVGAINKAISMVEGFGNTIQQLPGRVWSSIESMALGVAIRIGTMEIQAIQKAGSLASGVVGAITSLPGRVGAIFGNMATSATNEVNSLRDRVMSVINGIIGFFGGIHLSLPSIHLPPLPHFSLSGSFSLNPPSVPTLGVNWYAQGGVAGLNGPQLIGVGEREPEAIIPLSQLGGGGTIEIHIHTDLDGRELAHDMVTYNMDEIYNMLGRHGVRVS
jgi:hypothetical protein